MLNTKKFFQFLNFSGALLFFSSQIFAADPVLPPGESLVPKQTVIVKDENDKSFSSLLELMTKEIEAQAVYWYEEAPGKHDPILAAMKALDKNKAVMTRGPELLLATQMKDAAKMDSSQKNFVMKNLPLGQASGASLLTKDAFENANEETEARAFIDAIINPVLKTEDARNLKKTLKKITKGEVAKSEDYQKISTFIREQAQLSTARDALNKLFVERQKPKSQQADSLSFGAQAPSQESPGMSSKEVLRKEIERRFSNEQWLKDTATASPMALAREQVHMQALQLAMVQKQLDRMEDLVRMNAAIVALQANLGKQLSVAFDSVGSALEGTGVSLEDIGQ